MRSTPAVATAFTLQVVEPHLNGPGGDVPVIVHDVRRGKTEVICGQGVAPAGATIAHYRSEGLDLVPGTGLLAACVPGTFETWMLLLRDFGTMSLAEVLAPAIGYAQNGYPLLERANATIATVADLFRDHWPTSAAVYLPDNKVPADRTLFTNNDARGDLPPHHQGGGERRRRSRRADRARAPILVATALLPKRSIASAARRRSWTPAASGIAACSPPTTWRAGRRISKRR